MTSRGFRRFAVAGHDHVGRFGSRLALDPEIVSKLIVLDIVTTYTMQTKMNKALATASYHCGYFLPEEAPLETRRAMEEFL